MNENGLVYHFEGEATPSLDAVGGKALSLIQLTQASLPVPPGFVLTTEFFRPWLDKLHSSGLWREVMISSPGMRSVACDAAKRAALTYGFAPGQSDVLDLAIRKLGGSGIDRFAVRSSSPEEDLAGASFAGGYETTLGVTVQGLRGAIRRSFASCLDARIVTYKEEHGFDAARPRIAVIVQQQIASDSAGVAFSLNPLNNCYDEVVINANFGLGETVVSGAVTPDAFVVDLSKQVIVKREIGRKEIALLLEADSGTGEVALVDTERPSLDDSQILAIAQLTGDIDSLLGKPIDIEWAIAAEKLYVLQARPITAYYPLPEVMITRPGEPKILYGDKTLLKQGINEPLTVMGTDFLARTDKVLSQFVGGVGASDNILTGLGHTFEGRMYLNISNNLKLQGHQRLVREYRTMDALASDILADIDTDEYIPDKLPSALKGMLWKALWSNIRPLLKSIKAFRRPDAYKADVAAVVLAMRQAVLAEIERTQSFSNLTVALLEHYMVSLEVGMASLLVSELSRLRLKRLLNKEPDSVRQKAVYLERALPNNVTIEMGMAMYRLASFPELESCETGEAFAARLQAGHFSAEFLAAWESFIVKYGFRCPLELDLGTPRYDERPAQLFEQLRNMALSSATGSNVEEVFQRSQEERKQVFEELNNLLELRSRRRAKSFRKQYMHLVNFGGMRESHKYHYIWVLSQLRKRVLAVADRLQKEGRLDSQQQAFDLTIDQLDEALFDPGLDLRQLAYDNRAYLRRLAQVRDFPRIFDSRGKILRPPRQEPRDGELIGQPISPGVVQGPVKVLHRSDEKPVLPGDILVARATDPGWTPLFVNAAAIVLEVGGLLQHGSLVAREYGKPCLAGIDGVTERLHDGQWVEVNGLTGVLRLIDRDGVEKKVLAALEETIS